MDLVTSKPLDQVAKDTDSAIASLRAAIISKKAKAKAGKKELHTSKGARKRQQSWKSIFDSTRHAAARSMAEIGSAQVLLEVAAPSFELRRRSLCDRRATGIRLPLVVWRP